MASDWIKVERTTVDKPEIRAVARICGISKGEAFAAWFRLWCYFDETTENGFIQGFTHADADDISRVIGMGKALESQAWITFDSTGCSVENWAKHNGQSAKARALAFERKRRQRCHADTVTKSGQASRYERDKSVTREEKRREEV